MKVVYFTLSFENIKLKKQRVVLQNSDPVLPATAQNISPNFGLPETCSAWLFRFVVTFQNCNLCNID